MRVLVLLSFLTLASPAAAQGPGLLVLEPVGAPDAASGAEIAEACRRLATERGYHALRAGAGSVVGSLDPATPDDLTALVARAGVAGAVALWLTPSADGWEVHVGVVVGGGASSLRLAAGDAPLTDAAVSALRLLLPAPGQPTPGLWGTPAVGTPSTAPPTAAAAATPTAATMPPELPAETPRAHRDVALLVTGTVVFGVFWGASSVIGVFGGYRDRSCGGWFVSCASLPPGTSWTPEWDNFRATSWIPLVGPWVQLAIKPAGDDYWPAWLVLAGLSQATGAALLIAGIAIVSEPSEPAALSVALVPSFAPGETGVTLLGRF